MGGHQKGFGEVLALTQWLLGYRPGTQGLHFPKYYALEPPQSHRIEFNDNIGGAKFNLKHTNTPDKYDGTHFEPYSLQEIWLKGYFLI